MEIALRLDQWAKINPDLLDEILQRIDSCGDYARFRLTCKSWYIELPKFPKHIKLPFLLLPFDDKSDVLYPCYHPEENRVICHLPLSGIKNTVFRGFCYGWLVIVGLDDTIRMLNPITNAQIHLPPISTFPGVVDYQPHRYDEEYTLRNSDGSTYTIDKSYLQNIYIYKIILSSPPDNDDQDFMAVALYGWGNKLCYCRRGDKRWIKITEILEFRRKYINDAIFYEGKVYAVDMMGRIYEYDMKTTVGGLTLSRRPSCDNVIDNTHTYLVQSSGSLLLVIKHVKHVDGEEEGEFSYYTSGFDIYKLDKSQDRWLAVKCLNDYVLVLGLNSSVSVLPHTISRNKGNRIYYSDDVLDFSKTGYDNGVFDLEDGTIHHFFSDLDLIWPSPIWLL